jgi:hypothetical protein
MKYNCPDELGDHPVTAETSLVGVNLIVIAVVIPVIVTVDTDVQLFAEIREVPTVIVVGAGVAPPPEHPVQVPFTVILFKIVLPLESTLNEPVGPTENAMDVGHIGVVPALNEELSIP